MGPVATVSHLAGISDRFGKIDRIFPAKTDEQPCSAEHQPGLCSTAFAQLDKQWTVPLASWLSKLFSSSGSGSALCGALVGGLFVLLAQLLANWAQRVRDRQPSDKLLPGH
jgi:hypothetical protein